MRCIGCRVNNSARWLIYTCEPYRAGGSNPNIQFKTAALAAQGIHYKAHANIKLLEVRDAALQGTH